MFEVCSYELKSCTVDKSKHWICRGTPAWREGYLIPKLVLDNMADDAALGRKLEPLVASNLTLADSVQRLYEENAELKQRENGVNWRDIFAGLGVGVVLSASIFFAFQILK